MNGRLITALIALAAPAAPVAAQETAPAQLTLRQGIILELEQLKRLAHENVVELRFKVINSSDQATSLKELGIGFAHQLGQVSLIDFNARKKYGIGHAGNCLCSSFPSRDGGTIAPNSERAFWAWFKPADQNVLAVEFPGFPPILGVPVE